MAVFNTRSRLQVEFIPENRRYKVCLRDRHNVVTIGMEPAEALEIAKEMLAAVAETDHQAVIEAMGDLANELMQAAP